MRTFQLDFEEITERLEREAGLLAVIREAVELGGGDSRVLALEAVSDYHSETQRRMEAIVEELDNELFENLGPYIEEVAQ